MIIEPNEYYRIVEDWRIVEAMYKHAAATDHMLGFLINIFSDDGMERLIFEPEGSPEISEELILIHGNLSGLQKCDLLLFKTMPFRQEFGVLLLSREVE